MPQTRDTPTTVLKAGIVIGHAIISTRVMPTHTT